MAEALESTGRVYLCPVQWEILHGRAMDFLERVLKEQWWKIDLDTLLLKMSLNLKKSVIYSICQSIKRDRDTNQKQKKTKILLPAVLFSHLGCLGGSFGDK